MAFIDNPAKEFQFRITLAGLNPFLAQEVNLPDKEVDVTEHGDTNYMVKTGGLAKIGHMMIDKICPVDFLDTPMWTWLDSVQSQLLGGGALPSVYKVGALVEQLANDGITTIKQWQLQGVWPHKINGVKFSRVSSSNTVERIELCVDIFGLIP